MLASVVIPTKDRPNYVQEAVESIFAGEYQEFEVFVVDQSADAATAHALNRFCSDARFQYVKNMTSTAGASSSRNIGIALSSGEIVVNTDDDVFATKNYLSTLVEEFSADPHLGFVVGNLTAPDYDRSAGLVPEFYADSTISAWRLPLVSAGASYCMRRTTFELVGGYDQNWGPGSGIGISDDGDICFRIIRAGVKWKVCPAAEIIHIHGFRVVDAAQSLLDAYEHGVGANFGRFTRRGDLAAGLWFLAREVRETGKAIFKMVVRRGSSDFRYAGLRWSGFRAGFSVPPDRGFVSAGDLAQLRAHYGAALSENGHRFGLRSGDAHSQRPTAVS